MVQFLIARGDASGLVTWLDGE